MCNYVHATLRRLLVSTLFHLIHDRTAEMPARELPVITATTDATMIPKGSTVHVTAPTVVIRVNQ